MEIQDGQRHQVANVWRDPGELVGGQDELGQFDKIPPGLPFVHTVETESFGGVLLVVLVRLVDAPDLVQETR